MESEYLRAMVRLYERDLTTLEKEIASYPNDSSLWIKQASINNPAGNLALHLCGNLQHYIGKGLANTTYVRNRPLEFSTTGLSRQQLLEEISKTKSVVVNTLHNFDASALLKTYPEKVFDYDMTVMYFLNHLLAHLNYHLGQINYHRRLLTGTK
jgi:hypothetical protein